MTSVSTEMEAERDAGRNEDSFMWRRVTTLGKGATGEVSVWEERETKRKLAVKICTRRRFNQRDYQYWMREVAVMGNLRHPNVVRGLPLPDDLRYQIKFTWTPLAMEYCSGGSLRQFCRRFPRGLPEIELQSVVQDLCAGLRYLHRKHIVHRDIKPDNIVVQETEQRLVYKITDLGYIKILDPTRLTRSFIGTIGYAAPEVLSSSHVRKYNYLVDYWSLGVTIFEVAAGFHPFSNIPICARKGDAIWARRTLRGVEYYIDLPADCALSPMFSNYLSNWLRTMLQHSPAGRNPHPKITTLEAMLAFFSTNRKKLLFQNFKQDVDGLRNVFVDTAKPNDAACMSHNKAKTL